MTNLDAHIGTQNYLKSMISQMMSWARTVLLPHMPFVFEGVSKELKKADIQAEATIQSLRTQSVTSMPKASPTQSERVIFRKDEVTKPKFKAQAVVPPSMANPMRDTKPTIKLKRKAMRSVNFRANKPQTQNFRRMRTTPQPDMVPAHLQSRVGQTLRNPDGSINFRLGDRRHRKNPWELDETIVQHHAAMKYGYAAPAQR